MKDAIVRGNIAGTALFLISATYAAAIFTPNARTVGVAVALALFAIGVATFIWGYFTAVQRSRHDEISVTNLFLLTAGVAESRVRMAMNGCLAAQILVALGAALSRTSTDGKSGSTLAFGVLVPLFGLGLNGLWASRNGTFSARKNAESLTSATEIGKDVDHG